MYWGQQCTKTKTWLYVCNKKKWEHSGNRVTTGARTGTWERKAKSLYKISLRQARLRGHRCRTAMAAWHCSQKLPEQIERRKTSVKIYKNRKKALERMFSEWLYCMMTVMLPGEFSVDLSGTAVAGAVVLLRWESTNTPCTKKRTTQDQQRKI